MWAQGVASITWRHTQAAVGFAVTFMCCRIPCGLSSTGMLDLVSGREGLTGAQERPGQKQQLAHDGGDHDLGTLALGT